jgi:hypothetical protein
LSGTRGGRRRRGPLRWPRALGGVARRGRARVLGWSKATEADGDEVGQLGEEVVGGSKLLLGPSKLLFGPWPRLVGASAATCWSLRRDLLEPWMRLVGAVGVGEVAGPCLFRSLWACQAAARWVHWRWFEVATHNLWIYRLGGLPSEAPPPPSLGERLASTHESEVEPW